MYIYLYIICNVYKEASGSSGKLSHGCACVHFSLKLGAWSCQVFEMWLSSSAAWWYFAVALVECMAVRRRRSWCTDISPLLSHRGVAPTSLVERIGAIPTLRHFPATKEMPAAKARIKASDLPSDNTHVFCDYAHANLFVAICKHIQMSARQGLATSRTIHTAQAGLDEQSPPKTVDGMATQVHSSALHDMCVWCVCSRASD